MRTVSFSPPTTEVGGKLYQLVRSCTHSIRDEGMGKEEEEEK